MKNLEIKTRYTELGLARRAALSLGARDMGTSRDADTYFRVPRGRLKLRQTEGNPRGTLIYYDRPDLSESHYSEYYLAPVGDPEATKTLLDAALGTLVTVPKTSICFCTARRASILARSRIWDASSSLKRSSKGRRKKRLARSTIWPSRGWG